MSTVRLPWIVRALQPVDFPHKLGIMDRVFGARLAAAGTVWIDTAANLKWKLDLAYAPNRWIVYGKYEGAAFLNWARRFLRADSVVVDSGANIGQMLLYIAQWIPSGQLLAFEPGRRQAAWLQECLDRHPTLPVILIHAGLGDTNRGARLLDCGPAHVHGAWNQVSDEGDEITLVRLDEVVAARSLARIDLWKLDVEGFEVNALMGAEGLLRDKRIRAVYAEMAGANGARVREYMNAVGYECFVFTKRGRLDSPRTWPEHTNGLFLPRANPPADGPR
jgi:FkbM family methyltransferase